MNEPKSSSNTIRSSSVWLVLLCVVAGLISAGFIWIAQRPPQMSQLQGDVSRIAEIDVFLKPAVEKADQSLQTFITDSLEFKRNVKRLCEGNPLPEGEVPAFQDHIQLIIRYSTEKKRYDLCQVGPLHSGYPVTYFLLKSYRNGQRVSGSYFQMPASKYRELLSAIESRAEHIHPDALEQL